MYFLAYIQAPVPLAQQPAHRRRDSSWQRGSETYAGCGPCVRATRTLLICLICRDVSRPRLTYRSSCGRQHLHQYGVCMLYFACFTLFSAVHTWLTRTNRHSIRAAVSVFKPASSVVKGSYLQGRERPVTQLRRRRVRPQQARHLVDGGHAHAAQKTQPQLDAGLG